ncbi:MAG: bifunctional hydroxymethylpyrimidine kinase/phosphomethylpyrimidine kinase [Methanobrevibacter sp.]|jgi:hydroxymethylpyrimidine/phosphomethylpyrimidine kinase|nr:bifunctional hydroxymethylpyrimidine kinase/phosphomethylpyrimidine kinase [Candidatus Methanovirga aequatorialis]
MIGISIAGFDPSGGAGILADIKTFTSLGIYGTSVITALTAQNPKKFFSTYPTVIEYIEEQFDSIVDEYDINYGKTGMLYSDEVIKLVHKKLKSNHIKYVVDPVMIASSGGKLSENSISKTLKNSLIKDSILITPNVHEAEILSGISIKNINDEIEASNILNEYSDVLITGGHLNGNSILNLDGKIKVLKEDLIKTNNVHGSGCSLSAAITSYLIKGEELSVAINKANKFVRIAIENGCYQTLGFQNISKFTR